MNEPSDKPSTFQSIFFGDNAVRIRVPDYQRAYSWEQKQIELFIADLVKYQGVPNRYYFGHFIAEDIEGCWEIVDGQQRITTFVLFLMVCSVLSPSGDHALAYSMIQRFSTVSYDVEAAKTICRNLGRFLEANGHLDYENPPSNEIIIRDLSLKMEDFTRSQRRMVLALLCFNQAFRKEKLKRDKIGDYIAAVMTAHCSHHLTKGKAVAVNIFEMHNTRGVQLTTLEVIKAKLMKFVYDSGVQDCATKVGKIQSEFGEIFRMEERLAERSFRGEMTMQRLIHQHLRVVDDGTKRKAGQLDHPSTNANADDLVEHVNSRLHYIDGDKKKSEIRKEDGVQYALNLAKEFRKSVGIVSKHLPAWDNQDKLVGDVLILDQDLSCQFFLIICRRLGSEGDKADGRIGEDSLRLWEKLLFTRDFHDKYYYLSSRDNFPELFESCWADEADGEQITNEIKKYLANGFRPGRTDRLQFIVAEYLNKHRVDFLNGAFHWHPWTFKVKYAIYKYEASRGAMVREVMKGSSFEHILPSEWLPDWVEDKDVPPQKLSETEREAIKKEIGDYINGIGNLLLLTPSQNTSQGNKHPADKRYEKYCKGGSYKEHDENPEVWRSSKKWPELIRVRGEKIFKFILGNLVGASEQPQLESFVPEGKSVDETPSSPQ